MTYSGRMPYTTQGYMTGADMADMADLHDWNADDEPNEECEAKGCDIPEGCTECRRCGAEVVEPEPDGYDLTERHADNLNRWNANHADE